MSAGKAGTLLPELADCCTLRTEPSARKMSGTHRKFRFRGFMPSSDSAYALAFRFGLPLRPPRLHHCRQFLPHGCTHRLATSAFLRGSLSLLRRRLSFPFCPTLFHRCRNTLAGCRAHTATFLATCWLSVASLGRTTTPYGLGT